MKCDKCGKEASVSLKILFNGNSHNVHLCQDCLKKYSNLTEGVDYKNIKNEDISFSPSDLESLIQKFIPSLDDVINGYYEYKINKNQNEESYILDIDQKSCPYCGNPESSIKNGVFGCPHCYNLDKAMTDKILKTYNNLSDYRGSLPRAERKFMDLAEKIKDLSQRLSESVATEDYELAKDLKDELDKLTMQVKR